MINARDLGIKDDRLNPFFCCSCGNRIGWTREEFGEEESQVYCEECAKQEINEGEDEE